MAAIAPDVRRVACPRRGDSDSGFTLIELLVVVIIIGILAAIAIPVYLGVQNNAKDAAVKSDLVNGKKALTAYSLVNDGALPPSSAMASAALQAATLNKYGWTQSTNTSGLVMTTQGTGSNPAFCLVGTGVTTTTFVVSTNTPVAAGSACPAAY